MEAKAISRVVFLMTLLLSSLPFTVQDDCTLYAAEVETSEIIEGLCVEEFRSPECRPFIASFNPADLPSAFALGENEVSVSRPDPLSLVLRGTINPFTHEGKTYDRPGMTIDFGWPVSALAREHIKGFLLMWQAIGDDKVACRIFKLDENNRDARKRGVNFRYSVEFLKARRNYNVRVYSMPPPLNPEQSVNKEMFVTRNLTAGGIFERGINPGDWYPSISADAHGDRSLKITLGPNPFNFTEFGLMLMKKGHSAHDYYRSVRISAKEGEEGYMFEDLPEDEYKVVVFAIDPYARQEGKCLCWRQEEKERHCSMGCMRVQTREFYLKSNLVRDVLGGPQSRHGDEDVIPFNRDPNHHVPKISEGHVTLLVVGLTVGTLLGAAFATAAVLCVRDRGKPTNKQTERGEETDWLETATNAIWYGAGRQRRRR